MATSTTRLGLRKPDPTDKPSRTTDLNDDWDKVDLAVGAYNCTSGARPTTNLYTGKRIYETDTKNRLVNATTPAATTGWYQEAIPGTQASAGAISNPFENLLSVQETDEWIVRYRAAYGPGVKEAIALGSNPAGSLALHECLYRQGSGQSQSFADNTQTAMTFPTAVYTTADVTRAAGNNSFTINRAGLWHFGCGLRWNSVSGGALKFLILRVNGATISGARDEVSTVAWTASCFCSYRCAVNDVITVEALQDNTGNTAVSTDVGFALNFFSAAWIRP